MYSLFNESSLQPGGGIQIPDFRRVKAGLNYSLNKVLQFYRANPRGLNGSHFLVRLLQNLNVPLSMDAEIFDDKVRDIALNLAMSMKLTSALSQGRVHTPGVFYGAHVTEILIANIDPYDIDHFKENWREAQSIRVLYHPQTDLWLHLPDGQHSSQEAGMAVININIPMLASQYRMWRLYQANTSDDTPRSVMQFLMEVPIPNMLYTHLDIAVLNRLIGQYFNVELKSIKSHHSFHLTNWDQDLDRVIERWLAYVNNKNWDFDTIVSQLPTVVADDFHEVLALPDMAFSQQVQWAVLIARLPLITYLVQFNEASENSRNQWYLNYIRRYLRQMDLNRTMRLALPQARYEDVMVLIDNGVRPYL